jgi:ribosomal-protein-alanine N-acetyltransferase
VLDVQRHLRTHIRWMIRRDMPEVCRIEADSFEYPWTLDDFLRCLRQRNCIGMVAEHNDTVVGYMVYQLEKDTLPVLNFAVDPDHRGRGVGRQMVDKLVGKLTSHRRTAIIVRVRESNLAAQLFFRRQGFLAEAVRHGYYADSGEDAYEMAYRIG